MGKVYKLRKKYKALCSKNVAISKSYILKKSVLLPNGNIDRIFKTRNEMLENMSETTVQISKQKFSHEPGGIRANKNFIGRGKNPQEVLLLNDDLSLSKKQVGQKTFSRRMKNCPRRHATKTRHTNLIEDINTFKTTLKEESFLKSPQIVVMNKTLERLSAECSFNSKEKMNAHSSRKHLC